MATFVSLPEGDEDPQAVGVIGLNEAQAEGVAADVVTSSNSGTQTQSSQNRSKNRRVLTEEDYLWVQGLREQAGVSSEQLTALDLDEAAYEELLADFVDRTLQNRLQIQQLQQSAVQAKRAQRDALRAAMTGEREVTKAEYEGLVEHHRRCQKECDAGVVAVGQQAGLVAGVDLKKVRESQTRLRQSGNRALSGYEARGKAQSDQRRYERVALVESVVLPVPESLLQQGAVIEVDGEQLRNKF